MPLPEINQSIREILEPLREQLRALDEEVASQERALAETRQARRELVRVLSVIDPPSMKTKGTKYPVTGRVGAETVASVEARLRRTPAVNDNGGFTATSLRRDHGFGDLGLSTLQKAIAVLHQQGVLRLDHRGRGGAHYFKLVGE